MKVWLLQIPRLNDSLTWGIREVANILDRNGVDCEIIDINHNIYKSFHNTDMWAEIEKFGSHSGHKDLPKQLVLDVRECLSPIQDNDIVLLSVFSVESRNWASIVALSLRQRFKKNITIGMGGNGLRAPGETLYESEWSDRLLQTKLVDFALLGESSLILKKQIQNSFQIKGKLYEQSRVFPDLGFLPEKYIVDNVTRIKDANYGIADAHGHSIGDDNEKQAKVHFTQGCVKKCTFCDVPSIAPEWAMREADTVIDEIDHYYQNFNIKKFSFPDNTINGSDSEFLKFLQLLDKWQNQNEPINWISQFGVKSIGHQTPEMFELLNRTNAHLNIGFDHCSDRILDHMKKLYHWEDIENFLSMSLKYNVNVKIGLWMVGYPTEEEKDVEEYKKLFKFLNNNSGAVQSHSIQVCSINKNSQLLREIEHIDWNQPKQWISKNGLNFEKRMERKNWVDEELRKLNQNYYKFKHIKERLVNDDQ